MAPGNQKVDPVLQQWAEGFDPAEDAPDCGWFGARAVFYVSSSVEETVVLIQAEDRQRACSRALALFEERARDLSCEFEGTVHVYALVEPPGDGVEIFGTGRLTSRRQRARIVRSLLREGLVIGRRLRVLQR